MQVGTFPKGVPFLCTMPAIFFVSATFGQVAITLAFKAPYGADIVRNADGPPADICFPVHTIDYIASREWVSSYNPCECAPSPARPTPYRYEALFLEKLETCFMPTHLTILFVKVSDEILSVCIFGPKYD